MNHATTNRILQELERGQRLVLTFDDWHADAERVAVSLNNAGFRPVYERYLECAGELGPPRPGRSGAPVPGQEPDTVRAGETARQGAADEGDDAMTRSGASAPPAALLVRYGQAPPPPRDTPPARVHFTFDGVGLTHTERDHLRAFADEVGGKDGTIRITGHTDDRGDPTYNDQLARARAEAVRDYLARAGIPRERLRIDAAGESRPRTGNDSDDGRAVNRRARLELVPER